MASQASVHNLWRDIRLVFVLLVWAAFAAALFFYFDGSVTLHRAAGADVASGAAQAGGDALYTGSIIVVPRTGNDCWQMMLDNRTGRMWETGYVDCDLTVGPLAEGKRDVGKRAERLHAIGAAFRSGN